MDEDEHRDYIWECDYGNRAPTLSALKTLLEGQNEYELGACVYFINNNPYMFEFYVVLGYESPKDNQIEMMLKLMSDGGARRRTDVTMRRLIELKLQSRFNSGVVSTYDDLIQMVNSGVGFLWPEKSHFENIYNTEPIGDIHPVFLSHATPDKLIVEDIIPHLTRAGRSIWYDRYDIDYGQSIVSEIQSGIKRSRAVIFFISPHFLKSNWCETEMKSFLNGYADTKEILIISIISPEVLDEDLPLCIQSFKHLRLSENYSACDIAKEVNPTLANHFIS